MVGVSPCFRGRSAHGLSDRGIWRVHQFTKVEQIVICDPEDSWDHHEDLLTNAVDMWDSLGLHYRVVNICTGDMGTVAARKYDLRRGCRAQARTRRSCPAPTARTTRRTGSG